jgi:hypothetical protein
MGPEGWVLQEANAGEDPKRSKYRGGVVPALPEVTS